MTHRGWITVVIAVATAACSAAQPSTSPTGSVASTTTPDPVATVDPSGSATPTPGGPDTTPSAAIDYSQTSEAKIAAALEAGTIDLPTSLLYRVYAAFGSAQLPAAYQSPIVDLHSATFAFRDVQAHASELTPAINQALAPYLARPNDPASIFSAPLPVAAVGLTAQAPKWTSKPAASGKARVWLAASDSADAALDYYVSEVNQVWPKVFSLTREPIRDTAGDPLPSVNPDGAIDIYFADVGSVDPRLWRCHLNPTGDGCSPLGSEGGYTRPIDPFKSNTSSGYVVIDSAVRGSTVTSHIAHELMHTSQDSYDYNEGAWLLDSTATWGAFRTLQLLRLEPAPEYEYLGDFFAELNRPLRRDEGLNRYGSWLYFYSLQIDNGDEVARKVFENMAADGQQNAAAVDQAYPFQGNFGTFAMSNWNQDTADRYGERDPHFPPMQPGASHFPELGPGDDQLPFEISYLSADYADYTFTDDVRQVVFENTLMGTIAECACIPSVWLIAKASGQWKEPEEITGAQREYCFSRPEEDLDELVVVVANPDWEGLAPLTPDMMPTVSAKETDCAGYDVTIHYQSTSYLHASQWTITGDLEHYVEGMPLAADQPVDEFVGTGTYQGSQQIAFSCGLPAETWAGNGDVYLTGTIFEEGWIGADFIIEGPAMLIGVFHAGDIPFNVGEGTPNYLDLGLIPVPLAGGTTEYHFVKAAEAECNDEWATTTKVSLSPEVAAP